MKTHSLIKSSTVMAAGTVVSRVTGLLRGLMLVAALGTTLMGDTFNVANTMPNILYMLLIGGALTAVFVPQIVRATNSPDGGSAFISRLVTATFVFLGVLVAVSVVFAPLLVRAFASSYVGRPEFQVTTMFMRYCLPQIFFMGMYAIFSQISNAKDKFGPMMWAPVLNNLVGIAVLFWFVHLTTKPSVSTITSGQIAWLGIGTTVGYVIQAAVLIPVISRTKIKLRPRFDWGDPELRKSLRLAIWTFAFAGISQLSYMLTVNLSTSAAIRAQGEGITTGVGFTPYTYAQLLFMLPHSVVTISVVTALLPTLSRMAHEKKISDVHSQLVRAMRLVGIVTIPSSIAFLLFGPLITKTIFFGISNNDGRYLGYVLSAFALGLAPMSLNLIALRGLNAFENVRSQVLSNAIMNAVAGAISISFALALPAEWVTVGLAVALSVSYFVGAGLSVRMLHAYKIEIALNEVLGFYLKLTAFALIPAFPMWLIEKQLPGGNTLHLLVVLAVGGVGYLLLAKLFKVEELQFVNLKKNKLKNRNK